MQRSGRAVKRKSLLVCSRCVSLRPSDPHSRLPGHYHVSTAHFCSTIDLRAITALRLTSSAHPQTLHPTAHRCVLRYSIRRKTLVLGPYFSPPTQGAWCFDLHELAVALSKPNIQPMVSHSRFWSFDPHTRIKYDLLTLYVVKLGASLTADPGRLAVIL